MPIAATHLASTHSTNSQLMDWIKLSYQEFSPVEHARPHYSRPHLLTADTQTGGRGQHGRSWQSPLGNVYLSLYMPTAEFAAISDYQLTQRLDGRLSLCVGYQLNQMPVIQAINDTRDRQKLSKIGLKWVNDVGFYSGLVFQKLAGILIEPILVEGKMLGVIIGVGMNINHTPILTSITQEGLNYQAISLQDICDPPTQAPFVVHTFYTSIQKAIVQAIEQFNGFDDPSCVQQFIHDYGQVDVLRGKQLQINSPMANASSTMGQACGIDHHGSLQILQDDGTITSIWTGTIQVRQ